MSTVYRARDTVLDRTVAIKVLLPALAEGDQSYIARLQREARAAGSLRHPAVVKIYDTGTDGDSHYIVMEYVAGRRLDELIRSGRPESREAARISAQVADAVAAAHAAGILHRDIKPANVMIDPQGNVKVLDFGIARTASQTTLTQTASAIGTAAYMPPERVLGGAGDERSDIYAVGCLLYALLVGRPPFVGDSAVAIMHQQVHAEPMPLAKAGARVTPGLSRLVTRMLAKDPADRPGSAAEVARLLSMVAGAAPDPLPPTVADARVGGGSGRLSAAGAVPLSSTRRRGLTAAALILAAATVVAVALASLSGPGPSLAGRSLGMAMASVGGRVSHSTSPAGSIHTPARHAAAIPALRGTVNGPRGPAQNPVSPGRAKTFGPPRPPDGHPGWAGTGHGRHLGWQKHGDQQGWRGGDGGGD